MMPLDSLACEVNAKVMAIKSAKMSFFMSEISNLNEETSNFPRRISNSSIKSSSFQLNFMRSVKNTL
jgi:hypothetical protein